MGKRSNLWTEEKIKRYIKQGRGQGELNNYKPWLNIQDFPSKGRASRILGNTTKRVHHLFSDLEVKCFYLWDWDENIIDIREHYPLLNIEEIINLDDINMELFTDRNTGVNYVTCTNFLLTIKDLDSRIKYCARSVKSKSELIKKTTMEKLELERRYWNAKNIEWGIVTEEDIVENKSKNIEWIHGVMIESKNYNIEECEMVKICNDFLDYIDLSKLSIRKTIKDFEKRYTLDLGTGMFIFKYLIALKVLEINLDKEIDTNLTYQELSK